MKFSNTYIQLDSAFYQKVMPSKVANPKLLFWNTKLADQLGVSQALEQDRLLLAQLFSGNQLPEGAEPIALAYSGHQFGHFNPQLGDGRAHLLGEVIDSNGTRQDIQLKGSGPTRFSRQGDGRCALGPAIREYLMSEAMYALGVPTSRCLAVVATGEIVYREHPHPGAVVTRVATSHIRVGTFQYFAARGDLTALKSLTDHAISRHFPEIISDITPNIVSNIIPDIIPDITPDITPDIIPDIISDIKSNDQRKVLAFIEAVINKQIDLIVHWMRVGFIHGVMNTDNTAISGQTIDFGPCAMMGTYHPDTVFSSIDKQGRYAFGNQPHIAQWNMARLAECLLPLIDDDEEIAVEKVEPLIMAFTARFERAHLTMLSKKLGLAQFQETDAQLINDLLTLLADKALDYTQTFERLTRSLGDETLAARIKTELGPWYSNWQTRLNTANGEISSALALMQKNNPVVIPRNHHMEAVLKACEASEASDNTKMAEEFLEVLRSPYNITPETERFQDSPEDGDSHYHTFCGT